MIPLELVSNAAQVVGMQTTCPDSNIGASGVITKAMAFEREVVADIQMEPLFALDECDPIASIGCQCDDECESFAYYIDWERPKLTP